VPLNNLATRNRYQPLRYWTALQTYKRMRNLLIKTGSARRQDMDGFENVMPSGMIDDCGT